MQKNTGDSAILEDNITFGNAQNIESRNSKENIIFGDENKIDEPQILISKILFNYFGFVYSMKTKYKNCSSEFEELYSFIYDYISLNIKACNLEKEWVWFLIYPENIIKNFCFKKLFQNLK